MPFKIDWEPAGVYRHYYGNVTVAERRASLDMICGDRRFDDLRYTLTNYLDVQDYETSAQATSEIAAMHIGPLFTNPNIRIVAVVQREDVLAAITDFKRLGIVQAPYVVFPTLPEARDWIRSEVD